jgi:hypothetical protein|tara:strand:- start:606 stop:1199 length:594 start_codon:yes stop_codon:yes gene_type:complete
MPLNIIQSGSGSPFIRFSIEENTWSISSEGGDLQPVNMSDLPVVFDVSNVQMGWLKLAGGRDWAPWPNNEPSQLARPSDAHSQGFSIKLFSSKLFGDEPVRELCTSQIGMMDFIKNLYDECERSPEFKTKVPAIVLGDAPKRKLGRGSTRTPSFTIKAWVKRPTELAEEGSPVPSSPAAVGDSQPAAKSDDDISFEI